MSYAIDITQASIYVGTYHKYNSGSLEGKWLSMSDYSSNEEFYEACAQLHADEVDPEYMFQDYEHIPESLVSESHLNDHFYDVLNAIELMDTNLVEPFFIWCNNGHRSLAKDDIDDLITSFEGEYRGKYDSDEDFAMESVDQNFELSDFVKQYFDYEAYARDLLMSDYWSEDGYVFSNR